MYLSQILFHTPTWVFAVFAALVILGLNQTRTQQKSAALALLPSILIAGWSAWNVHAVFPGTIVPLLAWAAAIVAVQPVGRQLFARVRPTYDARSNRVTVPGSWLPLTLMLTIFSIKYVVNVALALNPALHASTLVALGLSAVSGISGGLFASRMLMVIAAIRQARPDGIATATASAPSSASAA